MINGVTFVEASLSNLIKLKLIDVGDVFTTQLYTPRPFCLPRRRQYIATENCRRDEPQLDLPSGQVCLCTGDWIGFGKVSKSCERETHVDIEHACVQGLQRSAYHVRISPPVHHALSFQRVPLVFYDVKDVAHASEK